MWKHQDTCFTLQNTILIKAYYVNTVKLKVEIFVWGHESRKFPPGKNYTVKQLWSHISLNCRNCNHTQHLCDTIAKFPQAKITMFAVKLNASSKPVFHQRWQLELVWRKSMVWRRVLPWRPDWHLLFPWQRVVEWIPCEANRAVLTENRCRCNCDQ